jgi:hypothetical protein
MGAEGVAAIAEALMENATITRVNFWGESCADAGALRVRAAYMRGVSDNRCRAEGAASIAEALKWNWTITSVNMGGAYSRGRIMCARELAVRL